MDATLSRTAARNAAALDHWKKMRACDEAGDQAGYMEARTQLYSMFERLSFRVAAPLLAQEWLSPPDILQECRLAVLQTMDRWDPERGDMAVLLNFYTRTRVRHYLRNHDMIRRTQSAFDKHGQERCQQGEPGNQRGKYDRVEVLSYDVGPMDGCSSGSEGWLVKDSDDPYGRLQNEVAVEQALEYLNDQDRQAIALRFGFDGYEPHTYREMVDHIGHTCQTAYDRVTRALPILAGVLEDCL